MSTDSSTQWEDAELDDADLEDVEQTGPVTVVDKYFNFEMLQLAVPGITRIRAPDFNDLVYVPINPRLESKLVERAYYKKSDPAESVVLLHKRKYYYCGCIEYDNPWPTLEYPLNLCLVNALQIGEQVYTITVFLNKRMGRTASQRWRRECWDRLRPILQQAWIDYKGKLDKQESEEYFTLHSVVEDGKLVTEPARKPGRPTTAAVLNLSDEDSTSRNKLIQKHASYRNRYKSLEQSRSDISSVVVLLNNIYDQVTELGGVPNGWQRY